MNQQVLATVILGAITASAFASQVIESEEHYVRGLRDRNGLITQLNNAALEQSGNAAVKTFAKRMNDEYAAAGKQIVEIAAKLEISGVGNMGPGAGGTPRGGGAGGMPPNGAAPAGGPPPGAGAVNRGTGPGPRNAATVAAVKANSGDAFDKAYLAEILKIHEEIERNVLGELLVKASNPALVAWSGKWVVPYARNAAVAAQLLGGQGDGNPTNFVSGSSPEAANRRGPTIEQALPGQLFGQVPGIDGK